jgi:WD40 repeat protein
MAASDEESIFIGTANAIGKFNLETKEFSEKILRPHNGFVSCISVVDNRLWTCCGHEIAVWDAKTLLLESRFSGAHWGRINGMTPVTIGGAQYHLTFGCDGFKVWNIATMSVMITITHHGDEVTCVSQVGQDTIWTGSRSHEKSLLQWVFHQTRRRKSNY